jgi:hypothetical protein
MALPASPSAGALPRTPGYLGQDKGNELLTFLGKGGRAVPGGTPLTVQGKGAASPPCKRPETRLPPLETPPAFILATNIPAGGSCLHRVAGGWA